MTVQTKTAAPAPAGTGESATPPTARAVIANPPPRDTPPVAAVPNVKSLLDADLQSGDLVIDHGWLCEVRMPPELVTGFSPSVDKKPSKDLRYEAMSLKQIRRAG